VQKHADEVGLKQKELEDAVSNCQAVLHELEECNLLHARLVDERQVYEALKAEVRCKLCAIGTSNVLRHLATKSSCV
jgi:hypothetical protein